MKNRIPLSILSAALMLAFAGCTDRQSLRVEDLRCNNRIDPVGIEGGPHLSWTVSSGRSGDSVTGCRIRLDGQEYRSQEAVSRLKLESARKYRWKARVSDRNGSLSPWSRPASFVTGLPDAEWEGIAWIGYEELPDSQRMVPALEHWGGLSPDAGRRRPTVPHFRKEFAVGKQVAEAYLFVSGLGQYTLEVDGRSPDDRFLAPGWTLYSKTCLYNGYDLTRDLKPGRHVIGITAGPGFFHVNRERYIKLLGAWGMPMVRARLVIRYSDGSAETIDTDSTWKTAPSPTTFASIYGGEDYDARMVPEGWSLPGFNDRQWQNALIVKGPGGRMVAEEDFPLRVMDVFDPVEIRQMRDGSFVYDFGQNASGIPEIEVSGKAGDAVVMVPGELVDDDGYVTQQASGGPMEYRYTLSGKGGETWRPSFSYYGFRYVGLKGAIPAGYPNPEGKPVVGNLRSLHTRNSSPPSGTFTCSNELFNRIYSLIDWSIRSNLASVATDCPHREKLGWLEVPHLMGNSIRYAWDIRNLYGKIVNDMIDSQAENGLVPDIAPEYVIFGGGFRDSPEWGSSSVILPWYLYLWYGDTAPMERAWPMMARYMEYLGSKARGHILSHGLGDWFDLGQQSPGSSQLTPLALTATAIWYYDLTLMSRMGALLGKTAEAERFRFEADSVKQAFLAEFYDPASHKVATGSQTSYAMPLVTGLVDGALKEPVYRNLVDAVQRDGYALTAGDVGFHYLVRALQDAGADSVIWKMNARDDVPGYGYQLRMGATALTESWPALRYVSNNHMMLGHLMEWLFTGIGGIRQDEAVPGFGRIIIDPKPVGDLTWAETTHRSIHGQIRCRWEKSGKGYKLDVTIPTGTRAVIRFNGKRIAETGSGKFHYKIND